VNSIRDSVRWNVFIFVPYVRLTMVNNVDYETILSMSRIASVLFPNEKSERYINSVEIYLKRKKSTEKKKQ
jgi:hypothetical protein